MATQQNPSEKVKALFKLKISGIAPELVRRAEGGVSPHGDHGLALNADSRPASYADWMRRHPAGSIEEP